MKESTLSEMRTRAHFIAGRYPQHRADNDPIVESSLDDARKFLSEISKKIRYLEITGATTSSPNNIITVYWLVKNINSVIGVYVDFYGNDKCDVRWYSLDKSENVRKGISVKDVIELDLPNKFYELNRFFKPRQSRPSP